MGKDNPYSSKEKFTKISFLNICIPKTRTPKIVKKKLLYLKSHIDPHTLIMEDSAPTNRQLIHTKAKQSTGANGHYKPNEPNRSLQDISP